MYMDAPVRACSYMEALSFSRKAYASSGVATPDASFLGVCVSQMSYYITVMSNKSTRLLHFNSVSI